MYSASDQIHAALMSKRTANAVEEFCSLSEYYTQKQHSHCQNMLAFLKETILFWYNILKDKLSRYYMYMYFMHSNLYWNITLIFGCQFLKCDSSYHHCIYVHVEYQSVNLYVIYANLLIETLFENCWRTLYWLSHALALKGEY